MLGMCPLHRRPIVFRSRRTRLPRHAIRIPQTLILRHSVMRPVEPQTRDSGIPRHARRLLQSTCQILRHLPENPDLTLDDLLVGAVLHVSGDVTDEALLSAVIKHFLPEHAWSVEVFGSDLGHESDRFAGEVAVCLVEVDTALAEGDGFDGREVVGPRPLVVEGHAAVALEVGHPVGYASGVYGELLVVDADSVAVRVWVREESGLEDWVR